MARAQRKPAASNVVPLRLVVGAEPPQAPDADTITSLHWLLSEALAGRVRGLAYVAMHDDGKRYTIHTCGTAYKNPTFTIGTLSVLVSDLADRVRASN